LPHRHKPFPGACRRAIHGAEAAASGYASHALLDSVVAVVGCLLQQHQN